MKTLLQPLILMLALSAGAKASAENLKFIELYTSHGCSSCPPADRLLGELLLEQDDLLALEFHVDYWNSLIHGKDGNFVDPFSDAAYSQRQREYNAASLNGRPGVYTPQVVINGRIAVVGSSRRPIEKALSRYAEQALQIRMAHSDQNATMRVSVSGSEDQLRKLQGVDILLARYLDKATTVITGGENRHLELDNQNIVTELKRLGEIVSDEAIELEFMPPGENEGCVVFVQEGALSPVYAAAACP